MYIAEIILRNWMSFRGEHTLKLEPKAYAVIARLEEDENRSNFLGKSAFVEAIPFALDDWLNPNRKFDSRDAWITHGEKEGGVKITFDDGSIIERTKKVNASQKFTYELGATKATKDQAEELLHKAMGISAADFHATCFWQQRQAAKLLLSPSGDLTEIFSAWFNLEKLDKAIELLGERLRVAYDELDKNERSLTETNTRIVSALGALTYEAIMKEEAELCSEIAMSKSQLQKIEKKYEQAAGLQRAGEVIAEYEEIEAEGKKIRAEYDDVDVDELETYHKIAKSTLDTAKVIHTVSENEMLARKTLARGHFDGECPVAKFPCPATKEILSRKAANQALADEAEQKEREAHVKLKEVRERARDAEEKLRVAERLRDKLEMLRDRIRKLREHYLQAKEAPEPEDFDEIRKQLTEARSMVGTCEGNIGALQERRRWVEQATKDQKETEKLVDIKRKRMELYSALLSVFKTARRKVAEEALGEIEGIANADLATCGIPLSLEMRWAREGKGLAKTCEQCGRAFPSSERVKACSCGANRGPHMVNRLDAVMSDRSGGAEDIAGVALQLAASRWLREERASAWAVAILDEVFGQLDRTNSRALTTHLPRMLSSAGFRQSFLLAHSSSILDAMPGRIEIRSDGHNAKPMVIA